MTTETHLFGIELDSGQVEKVQRLIGQISSETRVLTDETINKPLSPKEEGFYRGFSEYPRLKRAIAHQELTARPDFQRGFDLADQLVGIVGKLNVDQYVESLKGEA